MSSERTAARELLVAEYLKSCEETKRARSTVRRNRRALLSFLGALGNREFADVTPEQGTINISERPAEANDRAVPGHWEGDLLMGKRMHAIAQMEITITSTRRSVAMTT